MTPLCVRVAPSQPHWLVYGGFELQTRNTVAAIAATGIDIAETDSWSISVKPDVLHVWGLEPAHWNAIYWAKRAGVATVLTGLFPYLDYRAPINVARTLLTDIGRIKRRILKYVDQVVVVNEAQADFVALAYRYSRARIAVIPNIVSEGFLSYVGPRTDPQQRSGYVLTVGSVCERKNQLALVRACRLIDKPLIIVGTTLPGEEWYGEAVRKEIEQSGMTTWIGGLSPASPELVATYAGASCFALVSRSECQPICLLEARAMNLPIVVSKRRFALDPLFGSTVKVRDSSIASIAKGIREATRVGLSRTAEPNLEVCRASAVGSAYVEAYRRAVIFGRGMG